MLTLFRAGCFVLLILPYTSSFAQQAWPNTLLWRISGNGLSKSSYLYGTMHLQDKRLFNFGDSLYHGLENVDGFAVEIDFKEYMDSLFLKGMHEAEESLLEKQKVTIDNKKIGKSADSFFEKLGIDKEHLTKKDLKKIRDYRINKFMQQGEMPTIVDGYLFGLALRQGKWMGAIEDVSDQLNLLDELGAELTPERVLESDVNMRKGLEQMIQLYLKQDLQSMNSAINGYGAEYRDALLTRRNIKMARRMDSLSALRTMFFAVGAAHLPGDSGVIALLRGRGFTVEPVFSSKKIAAETYAKKLQDIPWYKVDDEHKLYSVEMPGNPSQFNEFGEVLKMKMFFDITTMTFYLSSQTIGKANTTKDFEDIFKSMATKMGASVKQIKPKNVSRNGLRAMEESFDMNEGTFRVQLLQRNNSLFVLLAGSNKKANLASADVSRFFASFMAHDIQASHKEWVLFSLPEKAFSVKLPGLPKSNLTIGRQAEGTNWNVTTYDYVDHAKGLYYMVQVRDLNEVLYLDGDSAYFEAYVEETKKGMDSIIKKEITLFKGFPALYYDAVYHKNITYKTLHVIRGSRVYSLITGAQSDTAIADADTFFKSLHFEQYPAAKWERYWSEGFSTTAPAVIRRPVANSAVANDGTPGESFISYNPHQAIFYQVVREPFPAYYWTHNDSSYFADKAMAYIKEGDSLLRKKLTSNGNLKSIDLLVQKVGSNNLEKIRLLVNGDTLYTLISFIPRQYIDTEKHDQFFDDFRVTKEVPPTIYTNKAGALMEALKTRDSAQFLKALKSFDAVAFVKDDLPFLHKALLETYFDSASHYGVRERIMGVVEDLADASTIDFIAANYKPLAGEKESLKYSFLEVLAKIYTKEAYGLLKQLLLVNLPTKGSSASLEYALTDSLPLTRTLYPEVLKLSSDSIFTEALITVTDRLMDNDLVSLEEVLPYKGAFLQQAKKNYQLLKQDPSQGWLYINWISFLKKFNGKETNDLLQQYLKLPIQGLKYRTLLALVENGQQVAAGEMEKVAADKDFRTDLYEELKKLNRQQLFPVAYAKQQSLAESELYGIASDEYEVDTTLFIGERAVTFQGEKKQFYLYSITLNLDEGKESYLGVAGPYSPNTKELISFADASGIYWVEKFDKQKIEKHLKAFLLQMETAEE